MNGGQFGVNMPVVSNWRGKRRGNNIPAAVRETGSRWASVLAGTTPLTKHCRRGKVCQVPVRTGDLACVINFRIGIPQRNRNTVVMVSEAASLPPVRQLPPRIETSDKFCPRP
jgi:hypothetical protein